MHHLFGWAESQDSAVLVPTAALADPSMTVGGDNVQIPDYASLLAGAIGIGVNLTRAQLLSPSLRRTINVEIAPVNKAAEPASPVPVAWFGANPIQLDVGEQMQAYMAEDAAGASQAVILAWLCDAPLVPVTGEIFTVRVTNATTLVAYTWTNGALTFDQVLPVGRYAIVGADFYSAGLIGFRFLLQGSTPRPGGIGFDTPNEVCIPGQRYGGWGVWGEFEHSTPPTLDFLSLSADTAQVGFLDLVKVG